MSDDELRFEVAGPPVPCARARVVRNKRRGRVHGVTEPRTRAYEEHVGWAARAAVMRARWKFTTEDRYEIELTFYCSADRGDWDNLAKAATDPLKGIVWHDDQHVKAARVRVVVDRVHPRAEIVVRKIPWTVPPPVRSHRDARPSGPVPVSA